MSVPLVPPGPLSSSKSQAATYSWWWWTAAASASPWPPSPWRPSRSGISFRVQAQLLLLVRRSTVGKPGWGVNDNFPLLERKKLSGGFSANVQCWCRVGGSTILEICLNYSQHNESLKCERLKAQKIRRRPESCHGFHPEVSLISHSDLPWECHYS